MTIPWTKVYVKRLRYMTVERFLNEEPEGNIVRAFQKEELYQKSITISNRKISNKEIYSENFMTVDMMGV